MTARAALFWIAATCCVVAELAILRSVLVGRAAAAVPGADARGAARATRRLADTVWALLPAAGLLLVLYLTWRAIESPRPPARDVTAHGVTIGA